MTFNRKEITVLCRIFCYIVVVLCVSICISCGGDQWSPTRVIL
jgi:hypothetical protein